VTVCGVHRGYFIVIFFLLVIAMPPCFADEVVAPESILIRNVTLIDQQENSDGVLVNILISHNKLKLVTRDEIAKDDISLIVDAKRGFLLGKLSVGQPPSFLIFKVDPRKDVDVLLDTKSHAIFAMQRGNVLKNLLIDTLESATSNAEAPKKSGWLAYTPPPMALPMSYGDESKWNRWESKVTSGIFIAALLVDRQKWLSQDDANEQQVGDATEFDGGEIRGIRFGAVGTLNFDKPWIYTLFAASNAFANGFDSNKTDGFSMLDYRLDIPLAAGMNLSVGKQKEPISMERLMPLTNIAMLERSAIADSMLRARNVGAVLSGTAFRQRLTWAGGYFNDWIDSGESFNESSQQIVGRITGLPFMSKDQSNLLHMGIGWRYTDAKKGLRYFTTPEFNNSQTFVDTGEFDAESAVTYNLEASWRKGPVWVDGEYVRTDVASPSFGDPVFAGYHIGVSWSLSGEMRPYNKKSGVLGRLPVSASVYQGGKGAWEIALRWSDLDLTDGLIDGGEMDILSLGLHWWLSPVFYMGINYRRINLDRFNVTGSSDGLTARITLLLE
jgi:phosphate-selective porin OprO and OprP